jgi:DNA-binding SARP family transcriptional activator
MIEISLFGQVCVRADGHVVDGLSGKQRQILAILALDAGSPVSKERLADLLWQGSPPVSYIGTLDSYVCVLRRSLGLKAGRSSQLATTEAGFVLHTGEDVHVDLARFRELAELAEEATSERVVAAVEDALALVHGDLLSDVPYADWAVRARDSFRREVVELSLCGAQRANAIGRTGRAARLARVAIEHDPVCEDAWRQLMLAHWFSGRRGAALAAYGELRAAMSDFLGDEPGRDSQELYLAILRDTSDAGAEATVDHGSELRTLLRLLRQALECTPGVRAPARDSALSEVAIRALAAAC